MTTLATAGLRSLFRGVVSLTALELLTLLLSLLLLPFLMRVLGPAGFGHYAFGVAVGGALTMLVDFGFNQVGPKEVARAAVMGNERARIYWAVQLAKCQIALFATPALALLAWGLGLFDPYGSVLVAGTLGALAALATPSWFLQGLQLYRTLAFSLSLARLVSAALTLVFVRTPADAALAVCLQIAATPVAGLLAISDRRVRDAAGFQQPSLADSHRWLRAGRLMFLSTAAMSAYTTCVPLVLGLLTSPTVVGMFSAADKARIAGLTLLQPLTAATYPKFSRWLHEDPASGLDAARRVMWVQVAAALFGSVAIALLAEPAILWLVGVQFLPAVPTAQILGAGLVFTALTNALGVQVMIPLNMERAFTAILGAAAGCGLVAAWILCPIWLDRGAAVAVLGTEMLIVLLMALYLRHRGVSIWRRPARSPAIQKIRRGV